MATPEPAPAEARLIPYGGFRFVFALVNTAIWFVLSFGITSGISVGVAASGRLSSNAAIVFAATVALFVFFFGLPGALSGFLEQARQGRIALPPESTWGEGKTLRSVWLVGLGRGALAAAAVAVIGVGWLDPRRPPERGSLCLALGGMGAALAFVNAWIASRPSSIGDIKPRTSAAAAPTPRYFFLRVGLPQALGNGLITGLVALGTSPLSAGEAPRVPPINAAIDSLITGVVIASFMVLSAGGLAGLDRRLGRVEPLRGAAPSKLVRALFVVGASVVGGALALGLASVAPGGLPLAMLVGWKAALGAGIAGLFAILAARWEVTEAG